MHMCLPPHPQCLAFLIHLIQMNLTPWGQTALGKRTRKSNKYSNNFILRRHRKI
jgi:hypothetical protein